MPSGTGEAKTVSKLINQLLRGTSQNDWATVYSAYSQLHQMGSPVIGDIKSIILNSDWPAPRYGFEVKWLSILLSLVYDLDLEEGNAVVAKFAKGRTHFALKTIANTIKTEQNWPYRKYQIKQLNIFEDATLSII